MLNRYPDYQILVYDKPTYAGNLDNLLDVQDNAARSSVATSAMRPAVDEGAAHAIDTIVNFAAATHVDRSLMEPDEFLKTDVTGTYVLFEAARTHGIERYHQISTDEVYGPDPGGPVKRYNYKLLPQPILGQQGGRRSDIASLTSPVSACL